MNNGAKLPSAASCARSRGGGAPAGRGGPGARPRTRAAAARRRAPRPPRRGNPALPSPTPPPLESSGTERGESARELPSRRGLFLTCPPFLPSLSGLRARPPPPAPPPKQPRTQAPHLAQRLRTPSASPGPRLPPLHGHRAAKSQPGKDRLGAACLSAKYWNRLGWGRGSRRARPLASLRARSALPLQTRGGQVRAPRPPLDFVLLSSTPTLLQSSTKLELLTRGPSGSCGAKWGAASPISSLLPKPLQTHTPFTQQRPCTPATSRRTARPGLGRGGRGGGALLPPPAPTTPPLPQQAQQPQQPRPPPPPSEAWGAGSPRPLPLPCSPKGHPPKPQPVLRPREGAGS